jgi:hypothetical protein
MLKYLVSVMVVFRRFAASHIFERSILAGHATPERQPRFASPKKPSTRLRIGAGFLEAGGGSVLMFAWV